MFLIFLRLVSNKDNFSEVLNSCQCKSADRFYDFCYRIFRNATSIGKKFNCDLVNTLGRLDLLEAPQEAFNVSEAIRNESHVVFVSVTSDDYFNFSMSSLKCVREFYPDHKFILYGLDLSSNYTIPDNPNFEFRRFDTTPYPKFVDDLKIVQLKGLILAEVIRDYPILFWIDSNIAMRKPNVIKNLFDEISEYRTSEDYSPLTSLSVTDNKNPAVVNPGYRFRSFFPILQTTPKSTLYIKMMISYICTKPIPNIDELDELYTHSDCMCTSNKTGKSYNFCYPDPHKPGTYGVKFNCSFVDTMKDLKLIGDADNLISLSDSIKNEDDVVFVSAASEDHLDDAMKSLASIREYYLYNKYVLFGLNISSKGIDLLPTDPNFEFCQFNATPYPEYVTNWKRYHFKGLVMAKAMRDFPIIWWIDAHSVMVDSDVIGRTFKEVSDYRLSNGYSPQCLVS
ncbi:hypothetical protein L3Y34_006035 [Caenorhabditis briggsae]|uniref:Uncharacterized protein n=1 Tax=Caenorhabditis briggsae TaxID=6238 RepID=A0AAE9CYQ3_CAEBR|nr:hypothetical protein L3Y34_006035 [Caenorhabditis briggsae]